MFFLAEEENPGFNALLDLAARTAIIRGYPFLHAHANILGEFVLRLAIERFENGIHVDHALELFERCKKKHKNLLQRKLAEADRLFFGINDRKEQNENLALMFYEELANDLPEARSMCMVIYHSRYNSIVDEKSPESRMYKEKIANLVKQQVATEKFTIIGLLCLDFVGSLPPYMSAKLQSAHKLEETRFPLQVVTDRSKKIVSCACCEFHFYEIFAVHCTFFGESFCSVQCQMHRFILTNIDRKFRETRPRVFSFEKLTEPLGSTDCFDVDDPGHLIDHFNVKSLIKSSNQTYLKKSVEKKAFLYCAILLQDPLRDYIKNTNKPPLEIPVRSLWCQSALLLGHLLKRPSEDYLHILFANCSFLLQSGFLESLGESRAKEAASHISTIVRMALKLVDVPPVEVLFSFVHRINLSISLPDYFVHAHSSTLRNRQRTN